MSTKWKTLFGLLMIYVSSATSVCYGGQVSADTHRKTAAQSSPGIMVSPDHSSKSIAKTAPNSVPPATPKASAAKAPVVINKGYSIPTIPSSSSKPAHNSKIRHTRKWPVNNPLQREIQLWLSLSTMLMLLLVFPMIQLRRRYLPVAAHPIEKAYIATRFMMVTFLFTLITFPLSIKALKMLLEMGEGLAGMAWSIVVPVVLCLVLPVCAYMTWKYGGHRNDQCDYDMLADRSDLQRRRTWHRVITTLWIILSTIAAHTVGDALPGKSMVYAHVGGLIVILLLIDRMARVDSVMSQKAAPSLTPDESTRFGNIQAAVNGNMSMLGMNCPPLQVLKHCYSDTAFMTMHGGNYLAISRKAYDTLDDAELQFYVCHNLVPTSRSDTRGLEYGGLAVVYIVTGFTLPFNTLTPAYIASYAASIIIVCLVSWYTAVNRVRQADYSAVGFTGNPAAAISALRKFQDSVPPDGMLASRVKALEQSLPVTPEPVVLEANEGCNSGSQR